MIQFNGKYTSAKVMIDNIDDTTQSQIIGMINNPAFENPVSIMPDTHAGKGSVIGFTMPLTDKVIPNIVGVDINCGMLMISFNTYIDKKKLDEAIRAVVPFGMEVRKTPVYNMERNFPWDKASKLSILCMAKLNQKFGTSVQPTVYDYKWFEAKCNDIGMNVKRAVNSIGTLGGGNHFIEFGKSKATGQQCFIVHTGSRQLGLKICDYWQHTPTRKKQEAKQVEFDKGLINIKATLRGKAISKAIKRLKADLGLNNKVDKGLEYLTGEDMYGYLTDMIFCQVYAQENRRMIAFEIQKALNVHFIDKIETIHNYISFNDFVIRKGAVSAHKDEVFILPFNMEDGTLICKGKGNSEWNNSAPHGAGRLFSRTQAKAKFSSEVAEERMAAKGIYTSAVPVDEVKEAYKDPMIIENAIGPTAEIIDRIIPIMNMKDNDVKLKK
jgi:RNA-splicing ligase RtcB